MTDTIEKPTPDTPESPESRAPESPELEPPVAAAEPEASALEPPTPDTGTTETDAPEPPEPQAPVPEDSVSETPAPETAPGDDAEIENSKRLAIEIDNLDQGHWQGGQRAYKNFFTHAREIGELFKTLKPLRREDREPLWQRFSEICDAARAQQKTDRAARETASRTRLERLQSDLTRIRELGLAAQSASDFTAAFNQIKDLREWINGRAIDKENTTPGPLQRDDRQQLWEQWALMQEEVYGRRIDVRTANMSKLEKDVAEVAATAAEGDALSATRRIKEIQAEMRGLELSKQQRDLLRKQLDSAWQAAQGRMKDLREDRRRQRQEWVERMQGHVTRWKEQIVDLEAIRERIQGEITDCEQRIADARSEDFAETVRGWVKEKEERLQGIARTLAELQDKIQSVEAKISK